MVGCYQSTRLNNYRIGISRSMPMGKCQYRPTDNPLCLRPPLSEFWCYSPVVFNFSFSLSSCNKYYLNIGLSIEFASHIIPFIHLALISIHYLITHCAPCLTSSNCLSYFKDQIYLMLAVFKPTEKTTFLLL